MDPQRSYSSNNGAVLSGFINLLVIVIALVVIYYMYQFFFGTSMLNSVVIESGKITANQGLKTYSKQAKIYEGGEYTVNLWVYISGWNYLQGTPKHIFELGGTNFSSLLIALGGYKNTLSVRVDAVDASGTALGNVAGGLTSSQVAALFKPLSVNAPDTSKQCDIDEIDLQRWIQLTVVLNGNVCDVYMDGKLVRSCVLPSYYRVDSTGQMVKVVDRGGFDGYVSQISTYNYALNPTSIYNMYMSGPSSAASDAWSYFTSFFQKKQN
jgi:hypothetical protein